MKTYKGNSGRPGKHLQNYPEKFQQKTVENPSGTPGNSQETQKNLGETLCGNCLLNFKKNHCKSSYLLAYTLHKLMKMC